MLHSNTKAISVATVAFLVLMGIVLLAYQYSRPRGGTIVLPGGVTYLGPSPSQKDAVWVEKKGRVYPYAFRVPEALVLTTFPDDPYDSYAVTGDGIDPQSNVLVVIEDLSREERKKPYIQKSKQAYIEEFWAKQYNLTGVQTIKRFTNTQGLVGYRVKFATGSGPSPYDDVFFEVPGKPNLLIHLSHEILDPTLFDRIVDTVSWNK